MITGAESPTVRSFRRARVGETGRLVLSGGVDATVQRLMAMGLRPGVHIKVVRVAPLGDPITLEVGGAQVSLRRREVEGLGFEPDG